MHFVHMLACLDIVKIVLHVQLNRHFVLLLTANKEKAMTCN